MSKKVSSAGESIGRMLQQQHQKKSEGTTKEAIQQQQVDKARQTQAQKITKQRQAHRFVDSTVSTESQNITRATPSPRPGIQRKLSPPPGFSPNSTTVTEVNRTSKFSPPSMSATIKTTMAYQLTGPPTGTTLPPQAKKQDVQEQAKHLIDDHKGFLNNLDEEKLGQTLKDKALENTKQYMPLIKATFEQLGDHKWRPGGNDKEQVAEQFTQSASEKELSQLAQSDEGREVLETVQENMLHNGVTEEEAGQIARISQAYVQQGLEPPLTSQQVNQVVEALSDKQFDTLSRSDGGKKVVDAYHQQLLSDGISSEEEKTQLHRLEKEKLIHQADELASSPEAREAIRALSKDETKMFGATLGELERLERGEIKAADYMVNVMQHAANIAGSNSSKFVKLTGMAFSDQAQGSEYSESELGRKVLGGGTHPAGSLLEEKYTSLYSKIVEEAKQNGENLSEKTGFRPEILDSQKDISTVTHHFGEFLQVGAANGLQIADDVQREKLGDAPSNNPGDWRNGMFGALLGQELSQGRISPQDAVDLTKWAYTGQGPWESPTHDYLKVEDFEKLREFLPTLADTLKKLQ